MSERLVVDSIMTADGEVVPLGPVDKDGHRVPLDTTSLYGSRGEHYKVKSFVRFPLMDGWFMECAFTHDLIDVSSLHLEAPDSWEKLLDDLGEVLQQGGRSGHPACVYLDARGLCRGHMDKDGKCKLSDADCCVSWGNRHAMSAPGSSKSRTSGGTSSSMRSV